MPHKNKIFIVVNPEAGGGSCRRRWSRMERELSKRLGSSFDHEETTAIGHARMVALDAAKEGYSAIVACGGDGTIHEVVNGIYDAAMDPRPALGILAAGTGSDFIKTLKIPKSFQEQVEILKKRRTRPIDLGLVEYTNLEKKKEKRVFVNIVDAGIGAEVIRRLGGTRSLFGRKLSYLISTLSSYVRWPAREIHIDTGHAGIPWPDKSLSVVIANGGFFGGGMPINPTADLSDGYFDVISIGELRPFEALLAIPLLYARQILRLPGVRTDRAKKITLIAKDKVGLDIDGELVGFLPATFHVLPRWLEVLCL